MATDADAADPTELAGVAELHTESIAAWSCADDAEDYPLTGSWDDPERRLTPKRITALAVGGSLLAVVAAVSVWMLHDRPSAAPEPVPSRVTAAPAPSSPPTMTTVTAQPTPQQTVAIQIPTADMGVYDAQFIRVLQNAGWVQDDPSFLATRAHQFCAVLHQGLGSPELMEQKLVEKSHLSMDAAVKFVTTAMSIYPDCP